MSAPHGPHARPKQNYARPKQNKKNKVGAANLFFLVMHCALNLSKLCRALSSSPPARHISLENALVANKAEHKVQMRKDEIDKERKTNR